MTIHKVISYKFLIMIYFLNASGNSLQHISLQRNERSIELKVNERFEILSCTNIPEGVDFDTFIWKDEDGWQVVACPPSVKFLKSDETAPNYMGSRLFQRILMRAIQPGSGQVILERYNKQIAIDVKVTSAVQAMPWKKPKNFYGTPRVDVLEGDDYYVVKKGEELRIVSNLKASYPTYIWPCNGGWHLTINGNADYQLADERHEKSEYVNMWCDEWKYIFTKAGKLTLLFARGSERIKIGIKVEDDGKTSSLLSVIFG